MKKLEQTASDAESALWEVVAKAYPEIKTGDFPIDASFELSAAIEKAILIWLESNKPEGSN